MTGAAGRDGYIADMWLDTHRPDCLKRDKSDPAHMFPAAPMTAWPIGHGWFCLYNVKNGLILPSLDGLEGGTKEWLGENVSHEQKMGVLMRHLASLGYTSLCYVEMTERTIAEQSLSSAPLLHVHNYPPPGVTLDLVHTGSEEIEPGMSISVRAPTEKDHQYYKHSLKGDDDGTGHTPMMLAIFRTPSLDTGISRDTLHDVRSYLMERRAAGDIPRPTDRLLDAAQKLPTDQSILDIMKALSADADQPQPAGEGAPPEAPCYEGDIVNDPTLHVDQNDDEKRRVLMYDNAPLSLDITGPMLSSPHTTLQLQAVGGAYTNLVAVPSTPRTLNDLFTNAETVADRIRALIQHIGAVDDAELRIGLDNLLDNHYQGAAPHKRALGFTARRRLYADMLAVVGLSRESSGTALTLSLNEATMARAVNQTEHHILGSKTGESFVVGFAMHDMIDQDGRRGVTETLTGGLLRAAPANSWRLSS